MCERQVGDLAVSAVGLNVSISLPYIMAARPAGIDGNEEMTSLSPFVYDGHRTTPQYKVRESDYLCALQLLIAVIS